MSVPTASRASLELTDTALKLSKVIEREAKRRSALHNSNMSRVQANMSSHRSSIRLVAGAKSNRSMRSARHSSVAVAPTPEDDVPGSEDRAAAMVGPALSLSRIPPGLERDESRRRSEFASQSDSMMDGSEPGGFRQSVWLLVDDPNSSSGAYYVSVTVFAFITLSTATFIADTEPSLDAFDAELGYIEMLCAIVFTFELGVRILFCPSKLAFFRSLANWIDIAAILPYYLETILAVKNAGSLGAVRIVRLTRVARVLKMSRYSSAIQVFVQAIAISVKPLSMLIFLMAIAMIIFSSAVYFAELTPDGCRAGGWIGDCSGFLDKATGAITGAVVAGSPAGAAAIAAASANQCICVDPNPYRSITSSFWWSIVTMSTVGYGDMTPVTVLGKMIGCATVLTGMIVLALPITVIGTNFQKVMKSVIHETMKTNVDYLKGKRMLCRDEIQAILERFHAVTENIHLDIDDVISVYDTDNSGMLEDEELARFRHDLEALQNRAMMGQMGVSDVEMVQRSSNTAFFKPSPSSRPSSPPPESHRPAFPSIKQVATMKSIVRQLATTQGDASSRPGAVPSSPTTGWGEAGSSAASEPPTVSRMQSKRTFEQDLSVSSRSSRSSRSVMIDEEQLLLRLLDMQQSIEERVVLTEQRLETKMNNLTKILMRLEHMMEMGD